jgi:collagenase-like PrtC family protease
LDFKVLKSILGKRLERIIISAELNKELIEKFVNGLKVETEILGLGPILLFLHSKKTY